MTWLRFSDDAALTPALAVVEPLVCGPCSMGAHRWCSRLVQAASGEDQDCSCLADDARAHPPADERPSSIGHGQGELAWSELSPVRRGVALALVALTVLCAADFAVDDVATVNGQLGLVLGLPAVALFVVRDWLGDFLAGGAR